MDNDFNTALAISDLFVFFKKIKSKINAGDKSAGADINQIIKTYSLLGLFVTNPEEFVQAYGKKQAEIPAEVIALAEQMQQARAQKDYATADALRAQIDQMGYVVAITREGYSVKAKN